MRFKDDAKPFPKKKDEKPDGDEPQGDAKPGEDKDASKEHGEPGEHGLDGEHDEKAGEDQHSCPDCGAVHKAGSDHEDGYDAEGGDEFQQAVIKHLRYVSGLMKKKFESYEEPEAESPEDGHEGPGEGGSPQEVGVPVVAAKAGTSGIDIAKVEARFEGTVTALQTKIAKLEAERETDKLFASLKGDLVGFQIPNLDAVLAGKIAKGADVAREWAAAVKEFSAAPIKRSSEAPTDETAGNAPASKDPAEVEAYASCGPEVLTEARSLAAMYAAAPKNHFMRKQTLAAFLAAQPTLAEVK